MLFCYCCSNRTAIDLSICSFFLQYFLSCHHALMHPHTCSHLNYPWTFVMENWVCVVLCTCILTCSLMCRSRRACILIAALQGGLEVLIAVIRGQQDIYQGRTSSCKHCMASLDAILCISCILHIDLWDMVPRQYVQAIMGPGLPRTIHSWILVKISMTPSIACGPGCRS